jgi:hypothetical protein
MNPERSRLPKCEWHGELIDRQLPKGCPYKCESPFDGVLVLQLCADHLRRTADGKDASGFDAHAQVCHRCVGRIGHHPVIERLRAGIRGASERGNWSLYEVDGPHQCYVNGTGAKTTYEVWQKWLHRNKEPQPCSTDDHSSKA